MNLLPNASSRAQCTVRPNKLKRRSLGQRKVDGRAKQGERWLVLKNPEPPNGFRVEAFIGKI